MQGFGAESPFRLRKAYLISLCLTAQQALAQAETESEDQGAAQAQNDLLNQVLVALQNPSADHAQIYAQLGVALLLVAGLVYAGIQAMKPKE